MIVKPVTTTYAQHGAWTFWLIPQVERKQHKARLWRCDVTKDGQLEYSSPWVTLEIATIVAEAKVITLLPARTAGRILRAQRQPKPPGPLLDA